MTNEMVKKFIAECDIKKLREETETSLNIAIMNDYTDDFNEYYIAYVGDVVSGSYGQYQAKAVCEYFGIEYKKDDEDVWCDIDNIANKVAEELTTLSKLHGDFYFGHLEADGSFGLFYAQNKEGATQ
jgi:hypothetical protein